MKNKPVSRAPVEEKFGSMDLSWLDPQLFSEVKGFTVDDLQEMAIKFEFWSKQLRLAVERMQRVPLVNN